MRFASFLYVVGGFVPSFKFALPVLLRFRYAQKNVIERVLSLCATAAENSIGDAQLPCTEAPEQHCRCLADASLMRRCLAEVSRVCRMRRCLADAPQTSHAFGPGAVRAGVSPSALPPAPCQVVAAEAAGGEAAALDVIQRQAAWARQATRSIVPACPSPLPRHRRSWRWLFEWCDVRVCCHIFPRRFLAGPLLGHKGPLRGPKGPLVAPKKLFGPRRALLHYGPEGAPSVPERSTSGPQGAPWRYN